MRTDAIKLEDDRLAGLTMDNYPWVHERHRIFPKVLEGRGFTRVLDLAAGMGIAATRIRDGSDCMLVCNDISDKSLANLERIGLDAVSFDLDDESAFFPFANGSIDVVISLATLEHIIHLDHHLNEVHRILSRAGGFFVSVPNYSGIHHVVRLILGGRAFHDPMEGPLERYEFYAHVRYFTYKTLVEFIESFGFKAELTFLPLPEGSTRFTALREKSRFIAFCVRALLFLFYLVMPPRWAFHPVVFFRKRADDERNGRRWPRKVII
jgi:SAM-dependent methyltransferase